MNRSPVGHHRPRHTTYDVIIVGGAAMGASTAWFLSANPDFDGTVLVVERDPSYAFASTTHTNSCMRQQFSNEINVRISQFAAAFVRDFRAHLGGDPDIPDLTVDHFGYLYLADSEASAEILRRNQQLQASWGTGTKVLSADELAAMYPFFHLDGILCGSLNLVDEGYFDSGTMFDWWRRKARENGVEFAAGEVVGFDHDGRRVRSVRLASGETIACGTVVNAAGPRAAAVARMAGVELPVEPRKRFTFVFDAAEPLDRRLPLTIDPSGVHVRSDGAAYMAGCRPHDDPAVDHDDFAMDRDLWEDRVWPTIATRIPAFERVKVVNRWAGHYAVNTLDHNAIVGPHHEIDNLLFVNGFSGHGMQQSPAMGRGLSEWITYGEYRSLDLTPLGYHRIVAGEPLIETAVI